MSYMKRLSQHGGNMCEHFLVYHPTLKGGYLMGEQVALPSRLIVMLILRRIAAESRGSGAMRMNLGIDVGTQRRVLTTINAAYFCQGAIWK